MYTENHFSCGLYRIYWMKVRGATQPPSLACIYADLNGDKWIATGDGTSAKPLSKVIGKIESYDMLVLSDIVNKAA